LNVSGGESVRFVVGDSIPNLKTWRDDVDRRVLKRSIVFPRISIDQRELFMGRVDGIGINWG
jgi:hypothetical protein